MSDISTPSTTQQPTATLPPGYTAPADAKSVSDTATSGINANTFLQLLVAQLQYQDPNNPVDSTQFLSQTAAFEEVQELNSLQTSLTSLVSSQQASTAASMLGSQVVGTDDNGNPVTGVVSGVELTSNGPILSVGKTSLPLANVTSVSAPGTTPPGTSGTSSTSGTSGSSASPGTSGADGTAGAQGTTSTPNATTGATATAGSTGTSSGTTGTGSAGTGSGTTGTSSGSTGTSSGSTGTGTPVGTGTPTGTGGTQTPS